MSPTAPSTASPASDASTASDASPATPLSTFDVVRAGGLGLFATLCALNFLDDFGIIAFGVLSPDIQKSLGVSDTLITVIGAVSGMLILLGSVPAAVAADRFDRTRIIAATSLLLGLFTAMTGAAQAVWQLLLARVGTGVNKGNLPAFSSILADAVPLEGRARAYAVFGGSNALASIAGPVTAGAVASIAGGDDGWRWAFLLGGLPLMAVAVASLALRDPGRGRFEREAVLGPGAGPDTSAPAPIDEAFARLKRIKTFYSLILAFSLVGLYFFVVPTLQNLHLEDALGLNAGERGVVGSVVAVGGLIGAVLGGRLGDRLFARSPMVLLRVMSWAMLPLLATVLAFQFDSVVLFSLFAMVGQIPILAVFTGLNSITAAIVPPRLRSMGFALTMLYMAVVGGLGGSILSGSLSDSFGEAGAVAIVLGISTPAAMLLLRRAATTVDADIAAVGRDLIEEEEQRSTRLERPDGPLPGEPLLEVRRLDFSYGSLQVLFDVDVDVKQGEVLALLGTNGAGKSTLLRAVTGLGFPDSGVIRFGGTDITYAEPSKRVRLGVLQVPGGKAIFPSLLVEENLRLGGFTLDADVYEERRRTVLELFPVLRERIDQPAGTMSGGERQMLALAKGMLLDPRLLCIDELSLGLAPIVVEQLIEVVAEMKQRGVTMLIVEQSVNVALSLADRALFMEKGHVRFQGPAAELLERGDLVRAVFLGGEGG